MMGEAGYSPETPTNSAEDDEDLRDEPGSLSSGFDTGSHESNSPTGETTMPSISPENENGATFSSSGNAKTEKGIGSAVKIAATPPVAPNNGEGIGEAAKKVVKDVADEVNLADSVIQ